MSAKITSAEELKKATFDVMKANGVSDGYIRMVASRGPGDLGPGHSAAEHVLRYLEKGFAEIDAHLGPEMSFSPDNHFIKLL
jgi:hypothetical protein